MKRHDLKCWPYYFACLFDGSKNFEIRKNDRNFQIGDLLVLREWDPTTEEYSGREVRRFVTYLAYGMGQVGVVGPLRGLSLGYVALGLAQGNESWYERAQPGGVEHDDAVVRGTGRA